MNRVQSIKEGQKKTNLLSNREHTHTSVHPYILAGILIKIIDWLKYFRESI